MLIDTHAHIYSREFDEDRPEMIQRAKDSGLCHVVMPSISREEYPAMVDCLHRYEGFVSAALGLHPAYVKADYQEQLDFVASRLDAERWVAIGEIGLDYYWSTEYKAEQQIALREQLRWALAVDLPVIFHVREAFSDLISILKEAEFREVRGIVHSFTGGEAELGAVLELPRLMVALNGVATFKNCNLRDFVGQIPIDRLLVETDAPYLAPVPHRGKRNEPAFVRHTAEHLAPLWGMTDHDFASATTANARRLFGI